MATKVLNSGLHQPRPTPSGNVVGRDHSSPNCAAEVHSRPCITRELALLLVLAFALRSFFFFLVSGSFSLH